MKFSCILRIQIFLLIHFSVLHTHAQNEWYKPVVFDSGTVLIFSPDLRLKPGIEGSIELQAALRQLTPGTDSFCLVRNGNDEQAQYSISITGGLKYISFSNSKGSSSWKLPFTDTNFHQLVFVTHTNKTEFFCDARIVPMYSSAKSIGYSSGYRFGNELHIGDEENETVRFKLRTLRLWNRKLSDSVMKQVALNYGAPKKNNPADNSLFTGLIGYSFFTTESQSFFYINPAIKTTGYAGVPRGDYYVFRKDGPRNILYDISSLLIVKRGSLQNILPVIAKRERNIFTDTSLAYTLTNSSILNKVSGMNITNLPLVSGKLKDFTKNSTMPVSVRVDTTFMNQSNIRRMFGTNNGSRILTLSFVTSSNDTIVVNSFDSSRHQKSFCVDLPAHAVFQGLIIRQDSTSVNAVSMLYSFDIYAEDDFTLLNRINASGRWYEDGYVPAKRLDLFDTSKFSNAHGNYSTVPVYSIKDVIDDSVYVLFADHGAHMNFITMTKKEFSSFHKPDTLPRTGFNIINTYTDSNYSYLKGSAYIVGYDDGVSIQPDNSSPLVFPEKLTRPSLHSSYFEDKIAWGGTFSQDQRPALSKANFVGYNIFKMDPRNFQNDVYSSKEIFAYPAEGSYGYYSTDNRTIVPNGLIYRNDNVGVEKMKSATYSTKADISSAWGIHLGVNAGVEDVFSFSENVKYNEEMDVMVQRKQSKTYARTAVGKYALVLDKGTMPLSGKFIAAVNDLRNDLINGLYPDYYGFLDEFGTHYAYAVTYGGLAYLEITSNGIISGVGNSTAISIEAAANASIEDVSFGASGGYSQSFKTDSQWSADVENINFKTIGGSLSRGQGWSVAKGEEVPIFLDLRPVYELFSPTFFDDPVIWTTLRNGLKQTFRHGPPRVSAIGCDSTKITFRFTSDGPPPNPLKIGYATVNGQSGNVRVTDGAVLSIPFGLVRLGALMEIGGSWMILWRHDITECPPPTMTVYIDRYGNMTNFGK